MIVICGCMLLCVILLVWQLDSFIVQYCGIGFGLSIFSSGRLMLFISVVGVLEVCSRCVSSEVVVFLFLVLVMYIVLCMVLLVLVCLVNYSVVLLMNCVFCVVVVCVIFLYGLIFGDLIISLNVFSVLLLIFECICSVLWVFLWVVVVLVLGQNSVNGSDGSCCCSMWKVVWFLWFQFYSVICLFLSCEICMQVFLDCCWNLVFVFQYQQWFDLQFVCVEVWLNFLDEMFYQCVFVLFWVCGQGCYCCM